MWCAVDITNPKCMESLGRYIQCVVCLEDLDVNLGVVCGTGHFVCKNDIDQYVSSNLLPSLYKMRSSCCSITCPVEGCQKAFGDIKMFSYLSDPVKTRYLSTLNAIVHEYPQIVNIRNTLLDSLSLKCPNCNMTVDPMPDACAAVLCLSCGKYYCNCCFAKFIKPNEKENCSDAHIHAAIHSPTDTDRNAFLPVEIVLESQHKYQQLQIENLVCDLLWKCNTAITDDTKLNTLNPDRIIHLALLLCYQNIKELDISIDNVWNNVSNRLIAKSNDVMLSAEHSLSPATESTYASSAENTRNRSDSKLATREVIEHLEHSRHVHPVSPIPENPPELVRKIKKSHGKQLFNAVKSHNSTAVLQIMTSFTAPYAPLDEFGVPIELDFNYIDRETGYPVVMLALVTRQFDLVKVLIESGADVLAKSLTPTEDVGENHCSGRCTMYVLIEYGLLGLVRLAVAKLTSDTSLSPRLTKEDIPNIVLTTEGNNYCAVHVATRYNNANLVSYFVNECKADVNVVESEFGYPPIVLAMIMNNFWCVEELIKHNANVLPTSNDPNAPPCGLYVMIEKGYLSLLRLVVEKDTIDLTKKIFNNGQTVLHVAALLNRPLVLSYLLGYFLKRYHENPNVVSLAHLNLGFDANLEFVRNNIVNQVEDEFGLTPLGLALISRSELAARELLLSKYKKYVNIQVVSKHTGRSALFLAIEHGLLSIVSILVDQHKVDINKPITRESCQSSALFVAIMYKYNTLVPWLLHHGADVNRGEKGQNYTPLLTAVIRNDIFSVQLLLQMNADIKAPTLQGRTAIYVAIEQGFVDIVELLMDYSVSKQLKAAAAQCEGEVSQEEKLAILSAVADDPVTCEVYRYNALQVAVMYNRPYIARKLLYKYRANINVATRFGQSLFDLARVCNSNATEYVLLEYARSLTPSEQAALQP